MSKNLSGVALGYGPAVNLIPHGQTDPYVPDDEPCDDPCLYVDDGSTATALVGTPAQILAVLDEARATLLATYPTPHDEHTRQRADGRFEVADTASANLAHGCTKDAHCILSNLHAGQCCHDREHWDGPDTGYLATVERPPSTPRPATLTWACCTNPHGTPCGHRQNPDGTAQPVAARATVRDVGGALHH